MNTPLFSLPSAARSDTPAGMAERFGVDYLGKIPMDPNLMRSCDSGKSFLDSFPSSAAAGAIAAIVSKVINSCNSLQA